MSLAARVVALTERVALEFRSRFSEVLLQDDAFIRDAGVSWLGGARLQRVGRDVTLDVSIQRAGGWPAASSRYLLGTIPGGYRPAIGVIGVASVNNDGGTHVAAVVVTDLSGAVYLHTGPTASPLVGLRFHLSYVRA